MTGKLMIIVIAMACLGPAAIDASTADRHHAGVYLAQEAAGPPRTGPPQPEAFGSPALERVQPDQSREQRPAPKGDPLKPFEPTEKVKADQAIDFPADI